MAIFREAAALLERHAGRFGEPEDALSFVEDVVRRYGAATLRMAK